MGFLWTILIGGGIGALATLSPSSDRSSYAVNIVLGSLGGLTATYVGQDFGWEGPNDGAVPIGAVVGAFFLLAARRAIGVWLSGLPGAARPARRAKLRPTPKAI